MSEIIETIQAREDGHFRFRHEGRESVQVSGRKQAACGEAAIETESGDCTRMWWSNTSQRPNEGYPPDWPFIPDVDTRIFEAERDDSNLRFAVWTTDSRAKVADEIVRQCVDAGWERVSTRRALTRLRSGGVDRMMSSGRIGPLKQLVTLFEKS